MIDIEKNISTFVESQFPDFYKEEGPLFLLFTKEYYKWLEQHYVFLTLNDKTNFNVGNIVTQYEAVGVIETLEGNVAMVRVTNDMFTAGTLLITSSSGGSTTVDNAQSSNALYFSRHLMRLKDLDFTTDRFLVHFKEKYLKNIQFDTFTAKRTLIKAAQDLYSSKGTERSIDLLFKLVFGTGAETYYPGQDVLKPSSGVWAAISYLEVTITPVTQTLTGKQIYGSISGASAFCEYIIRRNVKGKIIDQLILTGLQGTFLTSDIITDINGIIAGAPKVIGSLTSVDMTTGGAGFEVGEVVYLTSDRGVNGRATVTAVDVETGLVDFRLIDGGWGYAVNTDIIITEKDLFVSNVTNSNSSITTFQRFETINQSLVQMIGNNVTGQLRVGDYVTNPDGAIALMVDVDQSTGSNTANVVLNYITGNIASNTIIRSANQQWLAIESNTSAPANLFFTGELVIQSNGSANVTQGVIDTILSTSIFSINTTSIAANGIHVGQYVKQQTTNATGVVISTPWESYTSYSSLPYIVLANTTGTFSNTNQLRFYPNASNTTQISVATPLEAMTGQLLKVSNVSGQRWYPGNTIYGSLSGEVNSPIVVSDVGLVYQSTNNVSASANLAASNTTALGVYDIINVFYGTRGNIITGALSNTAAEVLYASTGQGANASINEIIDAETVLLNIDFMSGNNDGYLTNSVSYGDMLLTGANSTYGYLSGVYVSNAGTGYDNTNIVVFSGGNTGAGSYSAANASIVTNATGEIQRIVLTSNTGNGYISNPTLAISNSTGGNTGIGSDASLIPMFPLGFFKFPSGDISTTLLDLLRFQIKTIGSIASLNNINPGENYNADPFAVAYEPSVAELGKKDIMLYITNMNGPTFLVNEELSQVINTAATRLNANLVSSNTAAVNEIIYSTDGIDVVASGSVHSYTGNSSANAYQIVVSGVIGTFSNTITTSLLTVNNTLDFAISDTVTQNTANGTVLNTNSTHIVVTGVTGTFAANSTAVTSTSGGSALISAANNTHRSYRVYGDTSKSTYNVANTAVDTSSKIARGIVRTSNSTVVTIKRTSLFTTFIPSSGNNLIGSYQGSNATILSVMDDVTSGIVGDNAEITTNVVYNEGSITSINVINSGYGYEQDEGVTIESADKSRVATGKANVRENGRSEGFYRSRDGFLSDTKKLHDGEYYQDYSYEVQSPIPLDKYNIMLKEVLHVAGTKRFGRVKTSTVANNFLTISKSTVTIS